MLALWHQRISIVQPRARGGCSNYFAMTLTFVFLVKKQTPLGKVFVMLLSNASKIDYQVALKKKKQELLSIGTSH